MTSPILGPDGELDQIRLLGLGAVGHHGVLERERRTGQHFGADVVLHLDTRAAARTDDLAATVSYADVAEDVVALLGGEPVDLLETLAERIAQVVLARRGVRAVDVTVHKPAAPLTVPFDDVQVSIRRRAAAPDDAGREVADGTGTSAGTDRPAVLTRRPDAETGFVLALGANLGDPLGTLRQVVDALGRAPGVRVETVSPLARTAAVLAPGQAGQPDYLNAVVVGATTLAPLELLALAHRLEGEHGRRRGERWGARTLDVDVVSVGGLVVADPVLTLPHPRAHARAFVLLPWSQADPRAVLPGPDGGAVTELAERAPDRPSVRWLAADWLTGDVPDLPTATGHGDAGAGEG